MKFDQGSNSETKFDFNQTSRWCCWQTINGDWQMVKITNFDKNKTVRKRITNTQLMQKQ
jgi:hypothetical protein